MPHQSRKSQRFKPDEKGQPIREVPRWGAGAPGKEIRQQLLNAGPRICSKRLLPRKILLPRLAGQGTVKEKEFCLFSAAGCYPLTLYKSALLD